MRILLLTLFAYLAGFLPALFALQEDRLASYLMKDGKLAQPLEVRDLQGGFAGFTGKYWHVKADGHWSAGKVFNEKLTEEKNGALAKEDLAKLAKALAAFDLVDLKDQGEPGVNPHTVVITFGKLEATLNLPAGADLPKVDRKAAKHSVEQRYTGIVETVRQLTEDKAIKK